MCTHVYALLLGTILDLLTEWCSIVDDKDFVRSEVRDAEPLFNLPVFGRKF